MHGLPESLASDGINRVSKNTIDIKMSSRQPEELWESSLQVG